MIDLYYCTSPNTRKVLIALEELGLEYQIKWTDIGAGDQFTPEYVKVNPNSKVPAIVDHDGPGGRPLPLFESGAILQYLAEKTGKLLPADPGRRWQAMCWVYWQVANQGPMAGQSAHFHTYAPQQGIEDEYAKGRYHGEISRIYQVLDTRLAEDDYIAGEYSIADIACYPWTRVARGHAVNVEDYPNVLAWSTRISERPAAQVKVQDPRESDKPKQFSKEQFNTLFRPGTPLTP